jgi:Family of unknown function (DUF6343)
VSGEPEAPRSALTLRLVLASFGLLLWIAAAVLSAVLGLPGGWVIAFAVLAVVALADLLIVAWRKRQEKS